MKDLFHVSIVVVNARIARVVGTVSMFMQNRNDTDIVSLEYNDYKIKIGDTVRVGKTPYKVNYIKPVITQQGLIGYDILVCNINNTSIFAFPFLGGNRRLMLWDNLFMNAFIAVPDHPRCIALLYRFSGNILFTKFESALCSFRSFEHRYDPDPFHVLFVFNVPQEAEASYDHFINGRYSQIDDLWKLKILDFHGFDMDGHTGQILFRDARLREKIENKLDIQLSEETELHSIIDRNVEELDFSFYAPSAKASIDKL